MKNITPEMADIIASNVTTLCRLWTIERKGGTMFYFTDHDRDLDFEGHTYLADSSFMATAVQTRLNAVASDLDVSVLLAEGSLEYFDMISGMYDSAPVTLKIISYANLDAGSIMLFDGKVSTHTIPNQQTALLRLVGNVKLVTKALTERYSATCRAMFGDARCKFDLATVTAGFTATAVGGAQLFTAAALVAASINFYRLGTVVWLTGDNAGTRVEVAGNTAGVVKLLFKPPYQIQVGDTGNIVRGCSKTLAACTGYNNVPNYRGEPFVPGDEGLGVV
jgi:uncharacterized phage protein (TIGR02218 family)